VEEGDPFELLGLNCRPLQVGKVNQGFFHGTGVQFWVPVKTYLRPGLPRDMILHDLGWKHVLSIIFILYLKP
jgi:hypothetical protein